jgi:hypothetical protein
MTHRILGFAFLFLAALSVPGYWALASDQGKSTTAKQPQPDKLQKDADRISPNEGRNEAKAEKKNARPDDKPPVCLGKTVKLEFKLVNPDDEQVLTVLCATDDFAISRKLSDTNGAQGCEVTGKLTKADDQGRLLLVFKADLHHMDSKEGVEATFTGKGSAILEIGKSKTLTVLGPSPLKVTATLGD